MDTPDRTLHDSGDSSIHPPANIRPLQSDAESETVTEVDEAALVTGAISGVMLAFGSYTAVISIFIYLMEGADLHFPGMIAVIFFLSLLTMVIGLVLGAVMALLVHGIGHSLGLHIRQPLFGALVGGLSGYFACLVLHEFFGLPPTAHLGFFLAGPCLAMLFGQIGGAAGGAGYLAPAKTIYPKSNVVPSSNTSSQFQFGLRQVMGATVWCCVLTTSLKLIGCSPKALLFVGTGIVVQVPVYFAGRYLWQRWRATRGSTSMSN